MHDVDKMVNKIGNRFNLILVASERLRELQRERKLKEEQEKVDRRTANVEHIFAARKKSEMPYKQTFREIEEGLVGVEYLNKIKLRTKRPKQKKFDYLEI